MKTHFENESKFWKWKHILKMKANFENESKFQKWKHILKMEMHFENENTFWVCPNFFFKKLRKLQLLQFYGCLGLPWRYRQLYVKRDEHDILTNFWQLLLLLSNMCHSTKKEIILHKWMCCSMATTVLYTLFFKLTLQDWDCPTLKLDFLSSCWHALWTFK